ncbi:hypothetical protein ABZX39_36870 [Streptomyces collinus]|uniref:hypothetical protein n=1 Tax=Streptomyces collinus TaxID=42684 RepID=UPI0033BDB998
MLFVGDPPVDQGELPRTLLLDDAAAGLAEAVTAAEQPPAPAFDPSALDVEPRGSRAT